MIVGLLIGIVLGAVLNGVLIWIVGRMKIGMEVRGFAPAFLAGLVVSVLNALIGWVWTVLLGNPQMGGLTSAVFTLVVAAVVLMIAGDQVRGLRVKGFGGALIAAIAMAVIAYVLAMALTGMAM